jgi:glycosyltransferase involved in cell wall biosynthesis
MATLKDVSILVTTFLRDGYLFNCLELLQKYLPECPVIVVDDGDASEKKSVLTAHTAYCKLLFDSGLPAKRNAGVALCQTQYLLLFCDDFAASDEARIGILKLLKTLEDFPELSIASGRVNNYAYEGFLEYKEGEYIRQYWIKEHFPICYGEARGCEITVNYFLMRVADLREILWTPELKIGGEHGDYFLMLKNAGKKVAWVPDVNIMTIWMPDGADPRYQAYRDRAVDLGHRIFKEKWNVPKFISFNGEVS